VGFIFLAVTLFATVPPLSAIWKASLFTQRTVNVPVLCTGEFNIPVVPKLTGAAVMVQSLMAVAVAWKLKLALAPVVQAG
jgi:hypothetical protein